MTIRTRTTGSIENLLGTSVTIRADGTKTVVTSDSGLRVGSTRTTLDNVVPDFRGRSARGEIINNRFSTQLTERLDSAVPSWSWRYTGGGATGSAIIENSAGNVRGAPMDPGVIPLPNIDVDNLMRLAGTQAWAGVASPEFDSTLFMAEAAKVYKTVTRPWETVWNYMLGSYRAAKKNRKGSALKSSYAQAREVGAWFSQEWMRYRYGIKPLLSDLDKALGILRDEPTHYPRYTSRGSAESGLLLTETTSPLTDTWYTGTVVKSASRQVSVRAGVLYRHFIDTQSRTGFSLARLPSTAWETVPFSFVADWFINIGEFIQAMEHKVGVVYLAEWTTVLDKQERAVRIISSPKTVPDHIVTGSLNCESRLRDTLLGREPRAYVGVAHKTMILDVSKELWQKRLLDVAAFTTTVGTAARKGAV